MGAAGGGEPRAHPSTSCGSDADPRECLHSLLNCAFTPAETGFGVTALGTPIGSFDGIIRYGDSAG
eukprot:11031576-Heterocapsa_arctica.AAC.1